MAEVDMYIFRTFGGKVGKVCTSLEWNKKQNFQRNALIIFVL